jgi:Na+/melibiose symporter-like transporter
MLNKKWEAKWQDFKAKTFVVVVAFLILGAVSWISGESDPVDAAWWGFWAVVWVVGGFSVLIFLFISIRELIKRK